MNVITSPTITGSPTAADRRGSRTRQIGKSENSRNVTPMKGFGEADLSIHFAIGI